MSKPTDTSLDSALRPGRGAISNAVGRFETQTRHHTDDGWTPDADVPPLRTQVRLERPRRILTRNTSPDLPFDRSVNPYRGCEHGCIYCFARPTHEYLGFSAGLDFETRLIARPDAPDLLAREISQAAYQVRPIAIGTNTDPYQPIEGTHRIMRGILKVLSQFNHPVSITTKGTMIERDIDILSDMAARGLVHAGISVTTMDRHLARRLEPRVPAPARRLATIARLAAAGIPVRAMVSPVIPGLTDHEVEAILTAAQGAGARAASWIILRLPHGVSGLFQEWLAEVCPGQAKKVMARVREAHGGKDYDAHWGKRMRGEGPYAALIDQRFKLALVRLGLDRPLPALCTDRFRVPPRAGDQLSLFEGL